MRPGFRRLSVVSDTVPDRTPEPLAPPETALGMRIFTAIGFAIDKFLLTIAANPRTLLPVGVFSHSAMSFGLQWGF